MKGKIFLATILALLIVSLSLNAQGKMGRYHKNLLYEADIYFVQGDYYYASELFMELIQVAPDDPEILGKLGICYYNLPTMKNQAEQYLEKAVKKGDVEALFYLAEKRISEYKFFDALDMLSQYEQRAQRMKSMDEIAHAKASAQRSIDMVKAPVAVNIKNLGKSVNSPLHDYAPVWDSEGRKLYFTSRRRYDEDSEKDISDQYDENIYYVDLDSQYLKVYGAGEPLNSRSNDAAVACAQNGKAIMIFRTRKDGFSGDLFLCDKKGYTWGDLNKLDDQINSKYHEASASFGNNDGTVLYFSSDRPGGFGGKDIYKVTKLPDGSWSQALNLGETINTAFDEDAPFISADGSLYFSSQGHTTMGGYDIFCATVNGEDWNAPASLGYPINTPGDDIFFTLDATGKKAYFSSERIGGLGLQDVYQVEFTEANTIIFKGEVVSAGEEIPAHANITLLNDENGSVEGLYQTDGASGSFVLALNTNRKYTVMVEADGYQTLEKSVFFGDELNGVKEVKEQLELAK